MTDPLHVLVYGTVDAGACDSLRIGMHRDRLAALGVEVRTWQEALELAGVVGPRAIAGADDPAAMLAPFAWADVIVFRRWRSTAPRCTECGSLSDTIEALAAHVGRTGHRTLVPDPLLRFLVDAIEALPALVESIGIVYETDDDVLDYPAWTGFGAAAAAERDVIETLLRRADLVTVATPVLATVAARYNDAVRVVRNAVDPAWYAAPPVGPEPPGSPRLLYYGVPVRLRDYALCRAAVEATVAAHPGARRIWLGAAGEPAVAAIVDELGPYVEGLPAFARALVEARPDIGLAPLLDEPFNRAKSELHWLEYSLAGAATVASATAGPGPYDVVRDGVDGLLARTPAEWRRALLALAASPDRRAELSGRARERILVDYDPAVRAAEWADAYRWAADHAGRGRSGRRELRSA